MIKMLKMLKYFFTLFTQSSGADVSAEHMTFLQNVLANKVDEANLQIMLSEYLSNQQGDASGLMQIIDTLLDDATIQGDYTKQDILDKMKNFIP